MEEIKTKLPETIYKRLEKAEIHTLETFLTMSKNEICNKIRLSYKDVTHILKVICETVTKRNQNLCSISTEYLHTGCLQIDEVLNKISTNGITEVYGESGSGKTQFCLQLSLQVQKLHESGGLNGGCIYMCTEDSFPSKRLRQMTANLPILPTSVNRSENYEDNIFIEHIEDVEQLKHCLSIRLPILISRNHIRLIIIDSITGAFRFDNETKNYISRSEDLKYVSEKLNEFSTRHCIAVVCVNQVTADPVEGNKPCLGLAWSNLVQTRLEISRCGKTVSKDNQVTVVRKLKIIFSPFLPVQSCYFCITSTGLS